LFLKKLNGLSPLGNDMEKIITFELGATVYKNLKCGEDITPYLDEMHNTLYKSLFTVNWLKKEYIEETFKNYFRKKKLENILDENRHK
jgi:hypothetical protein